MAAETLDGVTLVHRIEKLKHEKQKVERNILQLEQSESVIVNAACESINRFPDDQFKKYFQSCNAIHNFYDKIENLISMMVR